MRVTVLIPSSVLEHSKRLGMPLLVSLALPESISDFLSGADKT